MNRARAPRSATTERWQARRAKETLAASTQSHVSAVSLVTLQFHDHALFLPSRAHHPSSCRYTLLPGSLGSLCSVLSFLVLSLLWSSHSSSDRRNPEAGRTTSQFSAGELALLSKMQREEVYADILALQDNQGWIGGAYSAHISSLHSH